jgi:ABC-type transport system involved in cytochrome c biogenesis permease subunit
MTFCELSHYSLFLGLFVAFTYNKKEPPAFGAALAFWCILITLLGLLFCHISENLSPPNVSTAEAPFFYQISETWSNHEGSLLLWCWIFSFYGLLIWGRPQHNVSKRRGHRERISCSFVSNFVTIRYLQPQSGQAPQLYTPFVRRTLVDSELSSRRKRTFHGPALCYAPLDPGMKMSFEGAGRGSREGKKTHPQRLPPVVLPGPSDVRTSSIDEQRIYGALGIALFFSLFLLASSDPFVRNFFVCTEPLAEFNPVLQDPILSIHPPCIYAGEVASAMGFGLCRSQILNGILALHSPLTPMRRGFLQNGRLLRGCVGSQRRSSLFTRSLYHISRWLPFHRSLLMLLLRRFFAFSSLWTGARREQAKRVVLHGTNGRSTSPLCLTAGANTVVSDQEEEPIRIWILTCWLFLTVGISLGSWWAYHELGWGGWWFWDPVENASFMPWVSATACIHSVILPFLHSWTLFLNIVTFLCCVLGTFSIRSGLLASVHSFATDDTRGRFLWWFFLLITGISMILFSQMKLQASVRRTHKKEMVVALSTLVHLRHSARAQPLPAYCWAAYSESAISKAAGLRLVRSASEVDYPERG